MDANLTTCGHFTTSTRSTTTTRLAPAHTDRRLDHSYRHGNLRRHILQHQHQHQHQQQQQQQHHQHCSGADDQANFLPKASPERSKRSQSTGPRASARRKDTRELRGNGATGMLSTPLPDYKHSANHSSKSRAAADPRRKSSSTSGYSGSTKNASTGGDSRFGGDTAGRSSSISESTRSNGLTAVTTTAVDAELAQPFTIRNGRRCLRDQTLDYPLPCDLHELHRQTMRTMLLVQVFNGPICSPAFDESPPKRVLEVACGTGFWSVMCHRHFAQQGHRSISFTGIDIAPLAPRMDEDDMDWRFVQHDMRKFPLPFADSVFDLIMSKDLSLVIPNIGLGQAPQQLVDEYLRILRPGGTLEIWDGDYSIRMLLPHATPSTNDDTDVDQVHTNAMGIYTITPQTPFAAPQNAYLTEYNAWVTKAFEERNFTSMPSPSYLPMMFQETGLTDANSRRLAIPLSEVRWEREGVGGDGLLPQLSKGKANEHKHKRKVLTAGQAALRSTALAQVTGLIESLEPVLAAACNKRPDEWERWLGHMMADLLQNRGTNWGECLEVGAWWATKK